MCRILLFGVASALLIAGAKAETPPTIAKLIEQLQPGDTLASQEAAEALGARGPAAVEAIPALTATLKWRDVCRPAAFALARLGPKGVAALLEAAREPPLTSRPVERPFQQALEDALASAGPSAAPDLARALRHAHPDIRTVAARALGRMGPKAEAAIPDLMNMLIERKPTLEFCLLIYDWRLPCVHATSLPSVVIVDNIELRNEAAFALSRIGPAAVPALAQALRRRPDRLHGPSLWAAPSQVRGVVNDYRILGKKDFHLAGAIVLLMRLVQLSERLEINDSSTRYLAARALKYMEPSCAAALPALSAAVEDADDMVRLTACHTLRRFGPDARAALPALARSLLREPMEKKNVVFLASAVVLALKAIGPEGEAIIQREWLPDAVAILERGPNRDEWRRLRQILPKLGQTARSTATVLERLLTDERGTADSEGVLWLLSAVSSDPAASLVKGLAHPDRSVRRLAADLLEQLGPGARKAIPPLRAAATGEWDETARSAALRALLAIATADETVALLIEILDRRRCLLQFEGLPPNWMQELADEIAPDSLVQKAADHLGSLGADARAALPALRDLRRRIDPNDRVNQLALLTAVLRIDETDNDALNQMGRWLETSGEAERWAILKRLSDLGPRARRLAPAVHRLLGSGDIYTRLEVARALSRIDPDQAGEGVPVVIEALTLGGNERFRALGVLTALGVAGLEAVWEVEALLQDEPSEAEKIWILRALIGLGPTAAPVAQYAALMCDTDFDRTDRGRLCFELLRRIGPASTEGNRKLRRLLHDPVPRLRGEAARTLAARGPSVRAAIPRLRAMLEEDDQECQVWAAFALARISGDAQPYLPRLVEAIGRTEAAALALRELGAAAKPAAPSLLDLLERGDESQRAGAVEALRAMGSHAADAVPVLARLLKHRRPAVRAAATRGLSEMGGEVKTARATLDCFLIDDPSATAASPGRNGLLTR